MSSERMTARQFVGKEIRIAREAKGMSRTSLAQLFPVSESTIRWWESGRTVPADQYVENLIKFVDLPETVRRVIDDLASKEVAAEWLGRWVSVERRATSLLTFEPLVIPGLFQTPEYARAVLRLGKETGLDLEAQISERLDRQDILDREDPRPPLFHAILDEAAIRRPVGGPKTMSDQLLRVAELAQRDMIIVQVIPFRVGEHAGFAGSTLMLASLDRTEVAYVDNALRGDVIEKSEDVAAMRRLWQKVSSKARPEDESIDMIKEAATAWVS
jgi:transcriptional regulator with XRE-family HTH domain